MNATLKLKKKFIDLACKIIPQKQLFNFIVKFFFRNKTNAKKHFSHFLNGKGDDLNIDIKKLLDDDCGIRQKVYSNVPKNTLTKEGNIIIFQWDFLNQDWKFALGCLNIKWQRVNNQIKLTICKKYFWKPNESRITQGIHKKADRMKSHGAKEFHLQGECYLSQKELLPTPQKQIPFSKMYLM